MSGSSGTRALFPGESLPSKGAYAPRLPSSLLRDSFRVQHLWPFNNTQVCVFASGALPSCGGGLVEG
jgi:hypothetical protein